MSGPRKGNQRTGRIPSRTGKNKAHLGETIKAVLTSDLFSFKLVDKLVYTIVSIHSTDNDVYLLHCTLPWGCTSQCNLILEQDNKAS